MARTRRSGMELLEGKIEKTQEEVIRARKRYDEATAALKELMDKRDALRKEELVNAMTKSKRSYEEIMQFLNAESEEEQ